MKLNGYITKSNTETRNFDLPDDNKTSVLSFGSAGYADDNIHKYFERKKDT